MDENPGKAGPAGVLSCYRTPEGLRTAADDVHREGLVTAVPVSSADSRCRPPVRDRVGTLDGGLPSAERSPTTQKDPARAGLGYG